jgi:hypothetical protein
LPQNNHSTGKVLGLLKQGRLFFLPPHIFLACVAFCRATAVINSPEYLSEKWNVRGGMWKVGMVKMTKAVNPNGVQ